MSDIPATIPGNAPDDVGSLALELARAYQRLTAYFHDQLELSVADADRRARGLDSTPEEAATELARMRERPHDEISWYDLNQLADRDPDAVVSVWQDIKEAARKELSTGHRAALALDWQGHPWSRARFLAIREGFHASTPPQTAIESALLDAAAEAFGDYLEWQEHLHMQVTTHIESDRRRVERHGEWTPMRLSYAGAIEQSARMAERAHARFLRTVATLDGRRRTGPVSVGHAGQVNVALQQVTIARLTPGDDG